MEFTHETNPKMKNSNPIMRIEITVSRFVSEPASIVIAGDLFMF